MDFKEFLLIENKQEIISLGFPKVITDILYENFGKNAFQIAKWNKDYMNGEGEDWWLIRHTSYSGRTISLGDYVRLYNANNAEEYKKIYADIFYDSEPIKIDDEDEFKEQKQFLRKRIEADLLKTTFFSYLSLIKDIKDGKLQDLGPYKKLSYEKAQDKYDKKNIFKDIEPLKIYENGWKWINAGKKCHLIGKMMKNCGSAGVMSDDEDRTIIALFDKGNKPHVIVTYSPNQKRISGEEGIGSSAVKDKYVDYILDLAELLDSSIDHYKTKSKLMKIKILLGDRIKAIEKLKHNIFAFDEYFKISLDDNVQYITNGYFMLSLEDLRKIKEKYNYNYEQAFNHLNRPKIEFENKDIDYIKISN
jgi:hypothetical protein